ncbi:conserved hypothetical protein [Neisseria meningitidis 053442]|uniref:Uncharacterized protein n=2 Tax=Neisseria meningitidis TaxID=487 RepID=E0N8G8_NEIM3|nr:conserved hypothetical protein [Neisseria meningitidis 053442]AHW75984.1 hypothetical protein NMA510612_1698 [Neisseria meningitidis]EFM04740.1 hypothetical protein HMPREF0602_0798 [Neisseria meningitidis ATCC 13091]
MYFDNLLISTACKGKGHYFSVNQEVILLNILKQSMLSAPY